MKKTKSVPGKNLVHIPIDAIVLEGELVLPSKSKGVVLFAHGSGSSRKSPRNTYVADILQKAGIGTLLFDLLTEKEDQTYASRFDIELLTGRLIAATQWVMEKSSAKGLALGYFGASTGAAAALIAAAVLGPAVQAVVSRGGRPDLAFAALERVLSPTLLIVGGLDFEVLRLNQRAFERLRAPKDMVIVPGATHLFEEPGKLEVVARLAADWFLKYLPVGKKVPELDIESNRRQRLEKDSRITKVWEEP
jgi:predicted alpha/beta-hydrolase family hydrolase